MKVHFLALGKVGLYSVRMTESKQCLSLKTITSTATQLDPLTENQDKALNPGTGLDLIRLSCCQGEPEHPIQRP